MITPPTTAELWVTDTSSILAVRRNIPRTEQNRVFGGLSNLVDQDILVYPVQVIDELERYTNPNAQEPDRPYEWVKRNRDRATRHGTDFDVVREILAHPQVGKIVDPDKHGTEEADPYVLALAYSFRETHAVTVLTEETRDRPDKISLRTACGHLRLVTLPVMAFLAAKNVWP